MGHACNSSGCTNIFGTTTPDSKIEYTGPPIPALNICTGDFLNEVEAAVLQKLVDFSTGVGISIPSIDLTTCGAFTACITCCGSCTDLPCLLNCYKNAICTLFGDVTTLQTEVTALLNGPYNIGCLQNIPTNATLNQIVQEIILEFCDLQTALNTLSATVSGFTSGIDTTIGNFLLGAISSCTGTGSVIKSGTGASAAIAFKGFVPVGGIIPFGGVTAGKFDSTGLGLAGTDFCGWAVANGLNGTVNMTGQVPVGLTNMGGSLPGNAAGLSLTTMGTQIGETSITLTAGQIPAVGVSGSVTATSPPHSHGFFFNQRNGSFSQGGSNGYMDATGPLGANTSNPPGGGFQTPVTVTAYVQSVSLPITVSTSGLATGGGGGSHDNMQPSTGLLYIQRIS